MNYWNTYFKGINPLKNNYNKERKIAFILTFLLINDLIMFDYIEKTSGKETKFTTDKKYSISDLYEAINSNENLDKTEKMLLINSWDLLNDYEKYIDYDFVIKQLSNFDINYITQEWEGTINTTGTWRYYNKIMTLYNIEDKNDLLLPESAANHEMCHLLNEKGEYYPELLKEAINSLFCSEYFSQENAYFKQKIIIEMICEIIDPEIIAKSYFQEDYQLIVNEFIKIDDDYIIINDLTKDFEQYQELYNINNDMYGVKLSDNEKQIFLSNNDKMHKILKDINNILCHYYYLKTGIVVNSNYIIDEEDEFGLDKYKIMNIYSTKLIYNENFYDYNNEVYNYFKTLNTKTAYFNKRNIKDVEYEVDSYKLKKIGQKE